MPNETRPVNAPDPNPGQEFYYAVQPNQMTYVDGNDVSRQIHIPKGKNQEARQHFMDKDWEALARFPTWSELAESTVHELATAIVLTAILAGSPEQHYSPQDFEKVFKEPDQAKR